jgi:hypothetical protein
MADESLTGIEVDGERLRVAIDRLVGSERPRYRRLWTYFKNPMRVCGASGRGPAGSERPYRQGQEWGLPSRITGYRAGCEPFGDAGTFATTRKEVVVENDIAWRVDTMVDYLFGRPVVITSAAPDPRRRELIGRVLRTVLARNGGVQFFQQLATLGSVYGFVDVLVKAVRSETTDCHGSCGMGALGEAPVAHPAEQGGSFKSSSDAHDASGTRASAGSAPDERQPPVGGPADAPPANDAPADDLGRIAGAVSDGQDALVQRAARMIRLEIVEPARALPLLAREDYRVVETYGQVWEDDQKAKGETQKAKAGSWWDRFRGRLNGPNETWPIGPSRHRGAPRVIELIAPDTWMRLEDGRPVAGGLNSLGEIPLVHIQNTAAAFQYTGDSDVEPLIPLQDELNTRLSDRAHRITLQSFKMYLGKGIEGFIDQPVSPGRLWTTPELQASVQEFGGDANCPSEDAHIADLREALDKSSGVTPIAAGAIKNRIGRLTSAAALRVTLLALLSKTDKKRTLYGAGIERLCELTLKWLDVAGVFPTSPEERRVELSWPSPLPENEMEKLSEAEAKLRLGVDRAIVLRELGY